MKPRLKWKRVKAGHYRAGPWVVRRYPYHRPVWELRDDDRHVGNFDTAMGAKDHAADAHINRSLRSGDQAAPAAGQHTKPCGDCPWRRTALAGWLGTNTADEWIRMAHGEVTIECHTLAGAQCAGAATYRANVCKLTRGQQLRLPADRVNVFSNPMEFRAHHSAE